MLFGKNFFLIHGWVLWGAWGVFALLQIGSARYLKGKFPRAYMWVHIISGLLLTGVTVFFSLYAQYSLRWKIYNNSHSYTAFPVLYGSVFVTLLGFFARYALRNAKWNTKFALQVTWAHRILGHGLILFATMANATGIYQYRNNIKYKFPLELFQVILYFFMAVVCEMAFQTSQAYEEDYKVKNKRNLQMSLLEGTGHKQLVEQVMTLNQLHDRVKAGEKLVILDDMVIDVGSYMDEHPGGRFLIEQNIGRDISKFFYGGFSTENINKV